MKISFIRRCRANIAVIVMLASFNISLASADTKLPRAWLVTKGNVQAVLVGESHFGNSTEIDGYYETVVRPSYLVADAALMETYVGPEQNKNEAFERAAPCVADPKGLHTERLRLAFDALIGATRDIHLDVPNWLENWQVVPEFQFASTLLDQFTFESLGSSYDAAVDAQGGPGPSFRLRADAKEKKKIIGLDYAKDIRSHFCSASATDRADFVADKVLKVSRLLRLKKSDPSYTSLGNLAAQGGQVVVEMVGCVDRAVPCSVEQTSPNMHLLQEKGWMTMLSLGTFDIMIKRRTHEWVPLIIQAMSKHDRTFIIVGAMHLPDLKIGSRIEPGLISLLRQQGFSVKRIAGVGDIRATFLAPSWFDRMRSVLDGI